MLEIIYMDGEKEAIDITEDNLRTYFPCIKKWINVNTEYGF